MKKITVGLFNDSFFPLTDGVIMVVDNYARRLSNFCNVIVFVPNYLFSKFDDTTLPYKVVRCYSVDVPFLDYSLPIPKLDYKFIRNLNKYKLDIVHIHSPFSLGVAGLKYAKRHHIPCIATMHSQFKQDFKRALKSEMLANKFTYRLMKVYNKCDLCFAVNKEVARIYFEEYHYKTMPRVLLNATDMEPIENNNKTYKGLDKKYNIKWNEKVFLFVGRLNILKNILFIVDSLSVLKKKKPSLKFKMLFVGVGQDEDKLKERIKELNLEKEVLLVGKIKDRIELASIYKRADLFLFPSVYDASSLVQIEAASQKTPGVFLKNTATSSTITDNVNGFLSDETVGAYSDKIIEVMENKGLYKKVSDNAYYDLYRTWDKAIGEIYDIYKELIDKK
ncbi:MAG: glycosyltransferase [Erysipelotrichaceae bacterium]|nr:glycosyltransferase [Erysipelotrichaceae bacterium]